MSGDRKQSLADLFVRLLTGQFLFSSLTAGLAAQQTIPSGGDGVVLVDAGEPRAAIVWEPKVADDPFYEEVQPYTEKYLPWAVEQITGARLKVIANAPGDDVSAILIGKSWPPADARKRFEQADHRYDSRILTQKANRIFLAGASVRGDAGAISDFIHDVLAVHLYEVDPIQWQIPRQPTLPVTFKEHIWTPKFVLRRTWYDAGNIPKRGELAENYQRLLAITCAGPGMNIGTAHVWSRVLPRSLFDQHPEYFAEVNGRRVPKQACISNAQVVKRFVSHYVEEFEERPRQEATSISPNDGAGYCECSNCLRMEFPSEQKQRLQKVLFPEGVRFEDGVIKTAATCLFFKLSPEIQEGESSLATLPGLEPGPPP